jgi:hypothetical protein
MSALSKAGACITASNPVASPLNLYAASFMQRQYAMAALSKLAWWGKVGDCGSLEAHTQNFADVYASGPPP